MPHQDHSSYYLERERQERGLAASAKNAAAAAIHLEMASRYAQMIANNPRDGHRDPERSGAPDSSAKTGTGKASTR